jgi:hypothetical protein
MWMSSGRRIALWSMWTKARHGISGDTAFSLQVYLCRRLDLFAPDPVCAMPLVHKTMSQLCPLLSTHFKGARYSLFLNYRND